MENPSQTFDKAERLCSIKIISGLFETGHIFYNSLFKVVWSINPVITPYPAQVAFSVSKRSFRHAVTRNLVKRRMREAYRKNKNILYDHLQAAGIRIVFIIILKSNKVPSYDVVEKAVSDVLDQLIRATVRS